MEAAPRSSATSERCSRPTGLSGPGALLHPSGNADLSLNAPGNTGSRALALREILRQDYVAIITQSISFNGKIRLSMVSALHESNSSQTGHRELLIVEDEGVTALHLREYLEKLGY